MPVADPELMKIVENRILNKKICRTCGAINPSTATRCRRCRSSNLRPKRKALAVKK